MKKEEALNQLIILAESWNSSDEFKPDWEDTNQYMHCPIFELRNGKYEFAKAGSFRGGIDPHISRFSFKTRERAEEFGKRFIDLFRIVLTN